MHNCSIIFVIGENMDFVDKFSNKYSKFIKAGYKESENNFIQPFKNFTIETLSVNCTRISQKDIEKINEIRRNRESGAAVDPDYTKLLEIYFEEMNYNIKEAANLGDIADKIYRELIVMMVRANAVIVQIDPGIRSYNIIGDIIKIIADKFSNSDYVRFIYIQLFEIGLELNSITEEEIINNITGVVYPINKYTLPRDLFIFKSFATDKALYQIMGISAESLITNMIKIHFNRLVEFHINTIDASDALNLNKDIFDTIDVQHLI